jgi:hypothetical protein
VRFMQKVFRKVAENVSPFEFPGLQSFGDRGGT